MYKRKGIVLTIVFLFPCLSLFAQENYAENLPGTIQQAPDGRLLLHASKGKARGTEIAYMPDWKAFGWFRSDGVVEWTVKINQSGRYRVYLEWSVSDEEAGKMYVFQAGKEKITGKVEKSGSWETFRKIHIGDIKLKKGIQKFLFKPESDFGKGALLDLREIELAPVLKD